MLALGLAAEPAQALTGDELKSGLRAANTVNNARDLFGVSGETIPTSQYVLPANSRSASGDGLAITICTERGGPGGGRCNRGSPDAVQFRLTTVHHTDRKHGVKDSWDYIFRPFLGDEPAGSPLRFIYRVNEGKDPSSGLIVGLTNDGYEIKDLKAADLEGFRDSELARFLGSMQGDEALDWAKENDLDTTGDDASFLSGAEDGDPFSKALQKISEIITRLSSSVLSALSWALDVGDMNDNVGLTQAWTVVRDIVNLIFILVLVAMALSSILRIEPQKYSVHQLLPLLVFSVLAVNFSFLFANILANTATVLSQPFLESSRGLIERAAGLQGELGSLADGFGESVVLLLASVIILVALAILLFFFIVRMVVIWILAALSPVLFLFMVLPFTRGESRNLLQTYIRWVYMAPVAFLMLFIGSLMLPAILNGADAGNDGATAIIQALFFAAIVIAAVAVPLALGGRIASMAAGQGKRVGGIGGKGGLGVAGMLPGPGGKTFGQRGRETKAFFKQRKDSQEQDAMLAAAHNRIAMAESLNQVGPGGQGLTRTLTGMSQGQQVAALESMVNQAQKEMIPLSISAKNRIAHGYKYGTVQEGGRYFAEHPSGDPDQRMEMDATEYALAQNRINSAAAFKELAQAEYVDEHMLQGPKNFAWTGYQQLHKGDPLISSYERSGDRINFGSLDIKTQLMDSDTLRGIDTNVLQGALGGDSRYLRVMRNLDGVRLSEASDASARNKFHSAQKQRLAYEVAQQGLLSSSVNRADFDTDAAYHAEVAKQRGTEGAVVRKYQDGRRSLGLPLDHPTI